MVLNNIKTKIRDWLNHLSLRWRLTLIFVLIFGISQIFISMSLFFLFQNDMQKQFDDAIFNYAVDVIEHIELGEATDFLENPDSVRLQKVFPFSLGTALIMVRHISGVPLVTEGDFGDFQPPYQEAFKLIKGGQDSVYNTLYSVRENPNAESQNYRLMSTPLDSSPNPQLILQIAVPLGSLENRLKLQKNLIIFGIPIVLLLATLFGYFLARKALSPVQAITTLVAHVRANDLTTRVPIGPAQDEISELAETFNKMLIRIEKAFQSQERFVADASHQLLSPLTVLKNDILMLKNKMPQTNQQQTELLFNLSDSVDYMTEIVNDMLMLSRVDAGVGSIIFQDVLVDELITEAISRTKRIADQKSIRLSLNISGVEHRRSFSADHDLLVQLFIILLENAVKYSPSSGLVQVEVGWTQNHCYVKVSDEGPGLSELEKEQIFSRFQRGKNSATQEKGFGLGLAIARKISQMHQSEIKAESQQNKQGSVFTWIKII